MRVDEGVGTAVAEEQRAAEEPRIRPEQVRHEGRELLRTAGAADGDRPSATSGVSTSPGAIGLSVMSAPIQSGCTECSRTQRASAVLVLG